MPSSCAVSTSSAAPKRGLANAAVLDLVRAAGLPVSAMGLEYGWIFSTGAERERLLGVFRECCENAVALGCGMMMSAIGPGTAPTDEAVANIRRAGEIAGSFGLRLTLEYQFQHPVVRSLDILRELIARAARANVGLLLDAHHLQRGGRPRARLRGRARRGDLPRPVQRRARRTAGGLPPVDRLPPGQGVVDWTGPVRSAGREGPERLAILRGAQSGALAAAGRRNREAGAPQAGPACARGRRHRFWYGWKM